MIEMSENVILEVRDLTTKYITRFQEDVYAVDHVSLKLEEGKTLGIAGESGCGKTTLARAILGVLLLMSYVAVTVLSYFV